MDITLICIFGSSLHDSYSCIGFKREMAASFVLQASFYFEDCDGDKAEFTGDVNDHGEAHGKGWK